jgi:hypothetical protein
MTISNQTLIKSYIISAISSDGYDVEEPATIKAKLQFLHNTFMYEYGKWHIEQSKSYTKSLKEWIAGLPSSFNIDFYNDAIIKKGVEFGALTDQSTDSQEWKYIENWFHMVATKTTQLLRSEGII